MRWKFLLYPFLVFVALVLLMDQCLQFRMSQEEVENYFLKQGIRGRVRTYEAGGSKFQYAEAGNVNGPAVIFVHGSPGSLSAFIDFLSDTSLTNRARLITVDRPGFGYSDFGNGEPSLQRQAAMLRPLLEQLGQSTSVILVGHSLGGPIAARAAMDYPDLVDGLILAAPSLDPQLEPEEWYRKPLASPIVHWAVPRSFRASNDEIVGLKDELYAMIPLWASIRQPVTIIQGCNDILVDERNADFAARHLTRSPIRMITVEGMDHFIPWTNPELISDAVLEQLRLLAGR